MQELLNDILQGHRPTEKEGIAMMKAKGRVIWDIASAADTMREQRAGDIVTYVKNQNINVTNICINSCGFCGFSRKIGDPDAFTHSPEEVKERARLATSRGVTEICSVSGLHPDFTADSYVDIIAWIREGAPDVHIHASNPMEVAYGAMKSNISTREMIRRLHDAGLDSMCGTAAEILVDEVRRRICPGKVDTSTWDRIIREVHEAGIPTTATIMYGHLEQPEDQIAHLSLIRKIQDDTKGFTEFVPLSFIHYATPLYQRGLARAGATGREDLLMTAVSRLFLDNFSNIQVSWVKLGTKLSQLLLVAGANDLGGTMYEENISKGAGAEHTDYLDPGEMQRMVEDIGRTLCRRTSLYERVPEM
jgi:FO synthase subunit 2